MTEDELHKYMRETGKSAFQVALDFATLHDDLVYSYLMSKSDARPLDMGVVIIS